MHELRRGRCWSCYARWVDTRPVGLGARCLACGERRRRVIKLVEIRGAWRAMCFNCTGQVMQLDQMPRDLEALRAAVKRDRRGADRRIGKPDTRVYQVERRVGERRTEAGELIAIEDDMIIEISSEHAPAGDDCFEELTRIRPLVDPADLDDVRDARALG
ncbi:MAG: hypothetical protein KF773_20595 [Deltaproteobacteria bacterium]|nr:hypothetical protein [Deltaproteobacteria bacterium]MCW5802718.1 hypothetical protein [Deltaproteobacteria bacterium]